jgi:hypothetical protein
MFEFCNKYAKCPYQSWLCCQKLTFWSNDSLIWNVLHPEGWFIVDMLFESIRRSKTKLFQFLANRSLGRHYIAKLFSVRL